MTSPCIEWRQRERSADDFTRKTTRRLTSGNGLKDACRWTRVDSAASWTEWPCMGSLKKNTTRWRLRLQRLDSVMTCKQLIATNRLRTRACAEFKFLNMMSDEASGFSCFFPRSLNVNQRSDPRTRRRPVSEMQDSVSFLNNILSSPVRGLRLKPQNTLLADPKRYFCPAN